jgi:hypothetical protein
MLTTSGALLMGAAVNEAGVDGGLVGADLQFRRADQQDCPARSVKSWGGHGARLGGCSRDSFHAGDR